MSLGAQLGGPGFQLLETVAGHTEVLTDFQGLGEDTETHDLLVQHALDVPEGLDAVLTVLDGALLHDTYPSPPYLGGIYGRN